jgi:hypothetical protein
MSKSNVVEIVTAETVEVEAPKKAAGKTRDLAKIGRHLARQIAKQGVTEVEITSIMERKLVNREQAKAVIAHATKTLEGRGKPVPAFI